MCHLTPTVATLIDDVVTLIINHTNTSVLYAADLEILLPAAYHVPSKTNGIRLECTNHLHSGELTVSTVNNPGDAATKTLHVTDKPAQAKEATLDFLHDCLAEVASIDVTVTLYRGLLLQRFYGNSDDELLSEQRPGNNKI